MSHAIAAAVRRLLIEDEAADLVEYALLVGTTAAACLALGTTVTAGFTSLVDALGGLLTGLLP
jgi:Flp pilus assembly pilin Flp